ncbi:MAG: chemotaxis protein CheA [Pseudomonadota bacterium]
MKKARYKEIFVAEATEHLQILNQSLLELESHPEDLASLNEMFRAAHTLKGNSASLDYEKMANLAHQMESVLDRLRNKEILINPEITDLLFESIDLLETLLDGIIKGEEGQIEILPILDKLEKICGGKASLKGGYPEFLSMEETGLDESEKRRLTEAVGDGKKGLIARVTLAEDCVFKSVRAFMVFKEIEKKAEIIKSNPDLPQIENEQFDRTFEILLTTGEAETRVKELLKAISEIDDVEVKPAETLLEGFDRVKKRERQQKGIEKEDFLSPGGTRLGKFKTVRVNIERLNNMMNLVGELVIDKSRLIQIGSAHDIKELKEVVDHLNRLTVDLQDEVMQARLVPVEQIFNRFPRLVRDLAKKEGKKIDFVIKGSEIELDRTILDEISDPLIHLLRNAVAHGIEPPQERERVGKRSTGSVKLTARREKEHVEIEVMDDGRGMESGKIVEAAVAKGMISKEEGERLTDREALMIICEPGLSLSEEATDLSGRGVGMDVVRTTIESLGGFLSIYSEKNSGSQFIIKLPLTIAIIRALLIKVSDETYVIPLSSVAETVEVGEDQIKSAGGREVVLVRGESLPLLRLNKLFELPCLTQQTDRKLPVVVIETEGRRAGLGVDGLVGQQEVVIKSLDGPLKGCKGYAGATILADGRVAFILDVAGLIQMR